MSGGHSQHQEHDQGQQGGEESGNGQQSGGSMSDEDMNELGGEH